MGRPYVAIRLTERRTKSRRTMRYRRVPWWQWNCRDDLSPVIRLRF